jgi:hypothetical protein
MSTQSQDWVNQDWANSDVMHWEEIILEQEANAVDLEALKKQVKKFNAQAMELKMALHDLSEELPTNWTTIPEVAARTFEAFQTLDEARKRLAAASE